MMMMMMMMMMMIIIIIIIIIICFPEFTAVGLVSEAYWSLTDQMLLILHSANKLFRCMARVNYYFFMHEKVWTRAKIEKFQTVVKLIWDNTLCG